MAKKMIVKTAKTVEAKRTHITMGAFVKNEDHVVHVEVAGKRHLVKSDNWYVAYPASEGVIGFPWLHCLIKNGVALFATPENYMRPRKYRPLNEVLVPNATEFERRS
jgi:hypothetical protein